MTATNHQLGQALQRQFGMLTFQFLLGMAVNLIGLPDELHAGLAKTTSIILLILHVLVALGLIVNAAQIARASRTGAPNQARLARFGAAAVGTAIVSGILTLAAPLGNLWSYFMAVAFIVAFGVYGRLYSSLQAATR